MRFSTLSIVFATPLALAAPSSIRIVAKRDAETNSIETRAVNVGPVRSQTVLGGDLQVELMEKIASILEGEDEDDIEEDDITIEDLLSADEEEDSDEQGEEESAEDDDSKESVREDSEETSEEEVDESETTELSEEEQLALANEYYSDIYHASFEPLRKLLEQHVSPAFSNHHFRHCDDAEAAYGRIALFLSTHANSLWELTTTMTGSEFVEDEADRDELLGELCSFLCKLGVADEGLLSVGEGVAELNNILINLRDALTGSAVTCPCRVENVFRHPTIEERSFDENDVELYEDLDASVEFEEEE